MPEALAPPRRGAAHATDRYGVILAMLIAVLIFVTLADESRLLRVIVGLSLVATVLATLRATGITPSRLRWAALAALVLAAFVSVTGFTDDDGVLASAALFVGAFLGYGAFALVRRVFEQPRVGFQQIIAAVEAYIQIALMFAFVFSAVARLEAEPFFASGALQSVGNFVYFSVVTISTLGYGDLSPATDMGRSLVMVETLFGQVFLVVLVAYLVGRLGSPAAPAGTE